MGNPFKNKVLSVASLSLIMVAGAALGIGNGLAFGKYSTVITHHLTDTANPDAGGNKSARNMGNQLAREIEREGIVLLKNDGALPLSRSITKVNVFGHGSIDWYTMSSGSEMVGSDGQDKYGFNEALGKYGVQVNPELPEFYSKWHKAEGDANTIFTALDTYYQVREPSLLSGKGAEEYQDIYERAKSFSDTAFFVLSRHAGENSDAPHYQTKVENQAKDTDRTYLQISQEEEYTLRQIANDFENVIVVLNSTNAVQLDFLDKIEGIDGCISVGATGNQGALSIPEILWGDASPSGHLTDTYPYDHKYNITYFRGNAKFTHRYTGAPSECTMMGSGGSAFYQTSCYVEYSEGIYVGYRWFETADAEGFWDGYTLEGLASGETKTGYDAVVQYPFGYGLSYTTFDWELIDQSLAKGSEITNASKIKLTIQVTNTGDMAGKDVIGVYLTAPYTDGGIEKSSVKLVAYAKSPELKPGQKSNVEIEVDAKEFKSYDYNDANGNGFKGYEMEKGSYELKLMTDAHHLKEMNINTIEYNVSEDILIRTDEKTGVEVKNLFTDDPDTPENEAYETISIDGSNVGQDVEYVHRNDFPELLDDVEPNKAWNPELLRRANGLTAPKSIYTKEMANAWDAAEKDWRGRPVEVDKPTWDAPTKLKLIEGGALTEDGKVLANDFDNPLWEELLNQLPFDHVKHYLTMDTQYKAPGVEAIGLRSNNDGAYQHAEGASQVGNGVMAKNTSCPGYPASTVLAQTWNQALAYMYGKSEGNDMGPAGKDALYSPACNIHRSPYGGRNSGYQSEDPYLSGRVVGNIIRGLGAYGRTTFVKHFVVNDQDFNRMALYTWLNEQALREIYLRTFEEAIKFGDSTGVMTSFNRLGAIWAGGNEALMTGVLREEWGFRGQIITDMTENDDHMNIGANLRSCGNINLGGGYCTGFDFSSNLSTTSNTPIRLQARMREAMHEIAYSYSHALWKNMTYNESADPEDAVIVVETKLPWEWWKPTLVSIDILAYAGMLIGALYISKAAFGKEIA